DRASCPTRRPSDLVWRGPSWPPWPLPPCPLARGLVPTEEPAVPSTPVSWLTYGRRWPAPISMRSAASCRSPREIVQLPATAPCPTVMRRPGTRSPPAADAGQDRVGERAVAGEGHQVAVDLGVDALAAAGADAAEPQLEAGQVGQRVVLGGAAALDRGLVPVAAQEGQSGPFSGEVAQEL